MIGVPRVRRTAVRLAAGLAVGSLVLFAALTPASAAAAPAAVPSTSFSYTSAVGDYIGAGGAETFSPSSTMVVDVTGTTKSLNVSVHNSDYSSHWSVQLTSAQGDVLRPGSFLKAGNTPGRHPYLYAFGNGRACNQTFGSFTVNQIGFDSSGAVDLADISLVQHCESSTAPAFKATIHLNQLPLSFHLASDAGDYIGEGVTKTYLNSTSLFGLNGSATYLDYSAQGLGDDWTVLLAPPTGAQWIAGKTYPTERSADGTHAGLDAFGDGRGCNTSTGTLTIKAITVGTDGTVTNLFATFVQHCEEATPALHGTIHYFA